MPEAWPEPLLIAVRVLSALAAGLVLNEAIHRPAGRLARRLKLAPLTALIRATVRPGRLLLPSLVLLVALPLIGGGVGPAAELLRHMAAIVVIGALTWTLVRALTAVLDEVASRHRRADGEDLEARRVHTQLRVLQRTAQTLIVVVGVAAVLMTFPRVREIGASLLVSAGFAGLVVGLAARPFLENLIAGLQLGFAQPVRIDDVVVVEGEWGRVEEITATYVVVRIWDQRRLIVPFARFISESFQNWTRHETELLGTVFLHVDYTVPVDAVRDELERICAATELWDRRVNSVQVTEAGADALQLRALVSAADAPRLWDLRCLVREQLIEYLQREHPDALPQTRVQLARRGDNG